VQQHVLCSISPCFSCCRSSAAAQATAIRDSLKSLFAEPRLPDNPYYYLASALGAYVDQNDLWQESDLSILTALDNEGGLEIADSSSRLCKLASCSNVWGLPHVLRCVNKEGRYNAHNMCNATAYQCHMQLRTGDHSSGGRCSSGSMGQPLQWQWQQQQLCRR
jgi:hypothetical protein